MATFQVSNKNKKSSKNKKKLFGAILLAVSTIVFLFSVTSLIPAFQTFFLGILGIFVYPLSVFGLILSLALLNDKKYVMPKRYAIFLFLSLYFFLTILQFIIVGLPGEMGYGEYMALNYSKRFTAGGMIIGFIPCSLAYLMGAVATYIILSLGLIVSIVFFVETILSLKKNEKQEEAVKINIKEKSTTQKQVVYEKSPKLAKLLTPEKDVNVMFDANKKEEEKKELSAREKLGLAGGFKRIPAEHQQIKLPKESQNEPKIPEGMTIREYLLQPPTVDIDKFMATKNKRVSNPITNINNSDLNKTINELKDEQIKPSTYVHEESYDFSQPQIKRGNLPEMNPEQITSQAEDIIREVVKEEISQRQSDLENNNEFIDFSDIENHDNQSFGRETNYSRDRNGFFGEENDFSSDRKSFSTENQNISRDRATFSRENFSRENNSSESLNRDNFTRDRQEGLSRENHLTNTNSSAIEKKKRFVELDSDTKNELVPQYVYTRPSIDLITTQSDDLSIFNEEIPMKRVALENALEKFGVPAKVQNVVIGPTVTRYEIEMPEGISVKKILSLDADIAYALSAKGQIRIEAPIPGRSKVGIEVPNNKVAKVSLKDVLLSKEFSLSPSPLTFALGKDITGTVKVCNLQKMPHLLVAGTTGSGKSVCLNTIITSLIYKSSPDEVKFIMIDPKQVELSMYEGLPHMVIPKVLTDPTKAVNALQWAVDEMERRFRLISEERVRNIDEYNKTDKVLSRKVKKMPYIVVIFDEFADFMAVAKNEIEDKIRRLAGKARAAGIHLILATQRPSTDVVTGTLKANLPARIAFKVASRVDSEVIMGATGAEKLLGYGDMLYKPADSAPIRLQGCFIDTPETKDIVNFVIQNNEETFDEEANNAINSPGKSSNGGGEDSSMDPMLPQALKICIDNGVASTTMVQRKLAIGYPRAARIIDQMEERGYISSAEGSKQRSVYITIEEFYQIFGDTYD